MSLQRAYGRRGSAVKLSLGSTVDLNIEQFIIDSGYPADPTLRVVIEIEPTACIEASTVLTRAIESGDLTGWQKVTLYGIEPETLSINGRGGAGGVNSGAVGGNGGDAMRVDQNSVLYMPQSTQDRVMAGGGGGGAGGKGGPGSQFIWASEQYVFEQTYFRNPTRVSNIECVVRYNNSEKYKAFPGIVSQVTGSDGKEYRKGTLKKTSPADWGGQDLWYAVQQGDTQTGVAGNGGYGGRGAGPCILGATTGDTGKNGTYGAGDGGDGGTGGALNTAGNAGQAGDAGSLGAGGAGGAGGTPGNDIVLETGGIIVTVDDPIVYLGGLAVPNMKDGVAMEPYDCTPYFRGTITNWSLLGVWPDGIAIDPATGIISGTSLGVGDYYGLQVRASSVVQGADSTTFWLAVISNDDTIFIGPDITIPELEQTAEMEPVDVRVSFDLGVATAWELVGSWPAGLVINEGIITGASSEAGSFSGTVEATGRNTAASNTINFNVIESSFVPTILLNVPLSDIPPPVEVTEAWPFIAANDFLLAIKFTMPVFDPLETLYAAWYKWQPSGRNIGVFITTDGKVRVMLNDSTGYNAITMDTIPAAGDIIEVKAFKSSTRGWMAWFNNVKDSQEFPLKTADFDNPALYDFELGHLGGSHILGSQMSCATIYSGDMTDAQIEAITLCEASTTPPVTSTPWLDDYDRVTPVNDPNITTDFSGLLHPKTLYIEGGMSKLSAVDIQKYQIINSNGTNFADMRRAQNAGHQFLGRGITPHQTMESNQYPRVCGQGWNIPFVGSTDAAGDMIDSSGYGITYGGVDCVGGLPIKWWLLRDGATSTTYLNANDTAISLASNAKFITGRYAVIRDSITSWANAEIVKITGKPSSGLTVARGYLSTKVTHPANSYIAQICVGDDGHPLFWQFNMSTACPVDSLGRQPSAYVPWWLGQQHVSSGTDNMHTDLNRNDYSDLVFKLIMYDVDRDFTLDPNADCTNDGIADRGFGPNGEELWINGVEEFYDAIQISNTTKGLPQVGGTENSGGDNGGCNGRQYESYPTGWAGADYSYGKLSVQMCELSFGDHRMKRGPAMNHILFKQGTAAYDYTPDGVTPDNRPFRLAMGMCAMEEAACHQQARLVPDGDPWYDEMGVDVAPGSPTYGTSPIKTDSPACLAAIGWLGAPIIDANINQDIGQRQRMFNAADFGIDKDLLLGQGVLDLSIAGWSGSNTVISHATDELHASAMTTYKSDFWATKVVSPTFQVTAGIEYAACFEIRASRKRKMRMKLGSHVQSNFTCDDADKKFIMTFTPTSGTATLEFQFGRHDSELWIKNVYIFANNPNVLMRAFTNGIVVVNLTNKDATVNLGTGSYQRILGTNGVGGAPQSPTINKGGVVSNSYIIPAQDAVFLVRQQ